MQATAYYIKLNNELIIKTISLINNKLIFIKSHNLKNSIIFYKFKNYNYN